MQEFHQDTLSSLVLPYSLPQQDLLRDFATRYIWWKTADDALRYPERILAQVMNLGTYEDLGRLLATFTDEVLRDVLERAEPGWFNERSWAFWHVRMGSTPMNGTPPPLPRRTFPE